MASLRDDAGAILDPRALRPLGQERGQAGGLPVVRLEEVMKQLEAVDATEARFDSLVRDMTDLLRHHADDEASEQFPRLRAAVPQETLIELHEKVDTAKKVAPTASAPPRTER